MTNEFLEAARNSKKKADSSESSSDRYKKLKKEQAGSDMTEAERRYEELKNEAKNEMIKKQRQKEIEEQREDKDKERGDEGFITH